jgi:23S rRNA (cytosine1962-C5)-methyltransferase
VSVDSSLGALERGRENLARNSCDLRAHEFVMDDVARFLARAARKNERFDIIILDPPSFGRARGAKFSSGSDYGSLAHACLELLDEDGILLACTNHRKTSRAELRKILHDAARAADRSVLQMKDLAPPPDFSGAEVTMKSVWLRLRG